MTNTTRRLLFATILFIIYGSLYPGTFQTNRASLSQAAEILSHSWPTTYSPSMLVDVVMNILIYLPLGILTWGMLERYPDVLRIAAPTLLGFVLSLSMEFLQVYIPGRTPSLLDLLTNTTGSAAGTGLGWLLTDYLKCRWPNFAESIYRAPSAALLLVLWTSSQWTPFIPGIGIFRLTAKLLQSFTIEPNRLPWDFLSATSAWIVALVLLQSLAPALGIRALLYPLLVSGCRFLVARQTPTLGELAGMFTAVIFYGAFLQRSPLRIAISTVFHLLTLVITGLAPFQFSASPVPFAWVPFSVSLQMGDWERAGVVLMAKSFRYGAAVWLLNQCQFPMIASGIIIAILLGAIEWIQTCIPGRSAEITDPVISLLLASLFWILEKKNLHSRSAGVSRAAKTLSK